MRIVESRYDYVLWGSMMMAIDRFDEVVFESCETPIQEQVRLTCSISNALSTPAWPYEE